ncbi:MAG TPA: site-specific integrase [Armatimonadota bacterium]|jgi:integrase
MGSVYKKGNCWYIRYDAPRTIDGKRRQIAKACAGMTKKQAGQHLQEIECQITRGDYQTPKQQRLETFFDEWLTHARGGLEASTFANYGLLIHAHIIPALGTYPLDKLTPLDIQRFYAKLQQAGSNRNSKGKPLSAKSIKNIHAILHKALAQAVRWGLLAKNPADAVDLPRRQRTEMKAITNDELLRLMGAIEDIGKWRIPLLIAIGTGMRRGEILALQWQDYNQDQRLLVVRRALSHVTTHKIVVKGTKTGRVRVVTLNNSLVEVLNQHRDAMAYKKPNDWICCEEDGGHMSPHDFTKDFMRLVARIGLDITLHGLRHTHATALLAAGIPVKVISERLGHSSVIITQDVYAHVLPTMQREAAEKMEKIWKGEGIVNAGNDDNQFENVKQRLPRLR